DRLIVSPGVEFQWEQVEGLAAAQDRVLHAWKAGPQTVALAKQLQSMADGGVFVLTIPPAAYRCPPGPYERACQVAWYLQTNKPKSKLIVLDANPNVISKTGLFRAAWTKYPNLEYRGSNKVVKVDPSVSEVTTELGDKVKYDVVNLIPPQRAGTIAVTADLVGADKRWCEADPRLPPPPPAGSRRRCRTARRAGRHQCLGLQRLPRLRRAEPVEHDADPRRDRALVLQEGDPGLRGRQAPVARDGALREDGR